MASLHGLLLLVLRVVSTPGSFRFTLGRVTDLIHHCDRSARLTLGRYACQWPLPGSLFVLLGLGMEALTATFISRALSVVGWVPREEHSSERPHFPTLPDRRDMSRLGSVDVERKRDPLDPLTKNSYSKHASASSRIAPMFLVK